MEPRGGGAEGWSATRRGPRAPAIWLSGVIAVLAASALYASVLIVQRQAMLRDVSRYNVSWTVSQAAMEVTRLQAAVGAFAIRDGEAERDAVRLWLDIILNRVTLLESGEVGDFARGSPELAAAVAEFKAVAAAAPPVVETLGRGDSAQRLMAMLSRLNPRLARLASAAHVEGGNLATRDLQQLGRLHWVFSCLLIGLIACGFALVGVFLWHNRLLQRAHAGLAAANGQARRAMEEVQLQNLILKERDRDLLTQNARFDAALNNMSQGLCMVDADLRLIVCNVRFLELFGLSPGVARPGVLAADLFRTAGAGGRYDAALVEGIWLEQRALAAARRPGAFFQEGEVGRAVAVAHQPMAAGGWVATYEDITERRRVDARISFLAHHDALTSLPNRVFFRDRMDEALRGLAGRRGGLALLCLDLDHFKTVNDTLGHPAGDALLEAVGRRLRNCARDTDVVARLGGDEFAVLQVSADRPLQPEALAERIIDALGAPYEIGGHRVAVGVSVGIAAAAEAGADADLLLRNADMALYRAKADGRGTYRFFEAEMDAEFQARRAVESDLREALGRRELEVFYQPLFDLATDRVSGFEALVRWRHPERGLIPPAQFVPIAEELGLIVPIGEWVLRRACADAAAWPRHLKVTVNLSPVQFRGAGIVRVVGDALAFSGLDPGRLELEITESTLLQDNERVVAMLHHLRDYGLRTALDDFGTGYSSLSYLRSFPFDKIKIDQSFVREMGRRPDCLAIVNSVAELARRLGMATTAEGVETPEQLRQVREAGCAEAQGYHFGRPRPLAEALEWLAATEGALLVAA
jgi:diguanylate cyclase (GGDEF)-like protein